ncbi:MAG: DeoR family transcriptional regulator [Candidatus Delongbacteria bacterium]
MLPQNLISDANPTQIRRKSDAIEQWIIKYLQNENKITSQEVRTNFNIHKDTAVKYLNKLVYQNKIVKKGGGNNVWYEIK